MTGPMAASDQAPDSARPSITDLVRRSRDWLTSAWRQYKDLRG